MEYEIKPKREFDFGLKELWGYKELFYFFAWRDIKVKYKQTVLGFLWAILQPFITMVVFTFFFGRLLQIQGANLPYPVFVLSGLLLWNIFSSGVVNAGNSMINNSNMIKKIYFPRLIIPFSAVLISVFDFLMTLIIFLVVMVYFNIKSGMEINWISLFLLLPVCIILTCIATFGMGTLLAALNIKFRDFRYLIPFMIQTLFFITPVIYPVSIVQSYPIKLILSINPMYASIELLRGSMTGIYPDMLQFGISLASSFLFLFLGVLFFRKTEYYFADLA
jgi:lipopolysaccharide transport system permease protein